MPRPRVVIVSYLLPHATVPHAGGQYLRTLCETVARDADLTLLVANTEGNKAILGLPGVPVGARLVGREFGGGLIGSALGRLTVQLDPWLRHRDPGRPYFPFAVGLLTSRAARDALRAADVVDLQWQDSIRLLPLIRRLNTRARVVGMFHDVQSQSFAREAAPGVADADYWLDQAARTRRHERRLVRDLDVVAAFSEKDLDLLGRPATGVVIRPPVARDLPPLRDSLTAPVRLPTGTPRLLLCVSYLRRFENDQGVRWLLSEVWPRVREQVPDARLRVAGAGASDEVMALAQRTAGAELLGYVDDLEAEYDGAVAALVPLHFGAGVKFKTVDALVRGVPIVTTTVGGEGIAHRPMTDRDLFATVADDGDGFAQGIVEILRDPYSARDRASRTATWARTAFGEEAFREAVWTAYGRGDVG